MENVIHDSPETKVIRQRMEEVRSDLNTGFQGIVNDARDIGDWTYYVRTYPWAVLGITLVAGYLVAPRSGFWKQPQTLPVDAAVDSNNSNAPPLPPPHSNISGHVLSFVGNLLMRGATAYILQQAERLFEAKTIKSNPNDRP